MYKIKNVSHNWRRVHTRPRLRVRSCETCVLVAREGRQVQPPKLSRIKVGCEREGVQSGARRERKTQGNWHALSYRFDRCLLLPLVPAPLAGRPPRVKGRNVPRLSRIETHGRTSADRSVVGRFRHSFVHTVGPLTLISICSCASNFSFVRSESGDLLSQIHFSPCELEPR